MPYRSVAGSLLTCALLLLLNACSTAGSAGPTTQATIRGQVVDSVSGEPIDSARAVSRTRGDTLSAGPSGTFELPNMPPGLYLFDVGSYGYHTHRHISALVRPGDEVVDVNVPLLPQELRVNCDGVQAGYHRNVRSFVNNDSNAVRLRLIDLFAQDGEVRVQPIVVSQVSAPLFMPDNLGARSHYDIQLVDADGNPVPFHHKNQDIDNPDRHRIYRKGDVLVVVPEQAKRLEPSILELEREVPSGTALYARMFYDFSLSDTLRATPETDFPEENLDSLQVPVYDTLRVDGSLIVPDSLVERKDTTVVRVVGVDTTVTRDGYLLYSTRRDTNAFREAEEAVRELYVPDSVKARARLDSLIAAGVDTSRFAEDTLAQVPDRPEGPPVRVVNRTNRRLLDSLVLDDELVRVLQYGLPRPGMSVDSLKLLTDSSLTATLQSPELAKRARNLYSPRPDSLLRSLSADSLGSYLQTLVQDSLVVDSLIKPPPAPDTARADSLMPDSMAVDSISVDSMAVDSAAVDSMTTEPDEAVADTAGAGAPLRAEGPTPDSIAADTTRPSAKYLVSDTLTIGDLFPASLPSDSLRARLDRAGVRIDSVVVDSTTGSFLSDPPAGSYYFVPTSKTFTTERVMVVDPVFFRLRSPAILDSARVENLLTLVPERVGEPPEPTIERVVQQIILVPTGGYRENYLDQWTAVQQKNLRPHYCEIFRIPRESPWRSTTTR